MLKRKYNLSLEKYEEKLKEQNGNCAICKIHHSELRRSMAVDHCHKTNRIRSLLCDKCNIILGHSKEDMDLLKNIIKYIKKYNVTGKTVKFDYKYWASYYKDLSKEFNKYA